MTEAKSDPRPLGSLWENSQPERFGLSEAKLKAAGGVWRVARAGAPSAELHALLVLGNQNLPRKEEPRASQALATLAATLAGRAWE